MEDPFEMDTPEVAPVPKKRSLFSASAIAKAAAPTEGVEFFSRAKDLHPRILAEEERKRQKKLMKLERKRSSTSADVKESTPPEEKRRRVSAQAKKQDRYSSDESQSPRNGESSGARRYEFLSTCNIACTNEITEGLHFHHQEVHVRGMARAHTNLTILRRHFQHGTGKR